MQQSELRFSAPLKLNIHASPATLREFDFFQEYFTKIKKRQLLCVDFSVNKIIHGESSKTIREKKNNNFFFLYR